MMSDVPQPLEAHAAHDLTGTDTRRPVGGGVHFTLTEQQDRGHQAQPVAGWDDSPSILVPGVDAESDGRRQARRGYSSCSCVDLPRIPSIQPSPPTPPPPLPPMNCGIVWGRRSRKVGPSGGVAASCKARLASVRQVTLYTVRRLPCSEGCHVANISCISNI